MPIKYVSCSEFINFVNCPLHFYHKHIKARKKLNVPYDEYANTGSEEMFILGHYRHKVFEIFMKTRQDLFKIAKEQMLKFNISPEDYSDSKKKFENFLNRYYINYKVISTEKTYETVFPNGVGVRIKVDVLLEEDENTLLINDYKTGDKPMDMRTLEESFQMKVYSMVLRRIFPQYSTIRVQLDPIGQSEPLCMDSTEAWGQPAVDSLEPIYERMITAKKKDFVPSLGQQCGVCEFYGACPKIKELQLIGADLPIHVTDKNLPKICKAYQDMEGYRRVVNKQFDRYKTALITFLESQGRYSLQKKWGAVTYKNKRIQVEFFK